MKLKVIRQEDLSKYSEFEREVNEFLSQLKNENIFKLEHHCTERGHQIVAIFYSE